VSYEEEDTWDSVSPSNNTRRRIHVSYEEEDTWDSVSPSNNTRRRIHVSYEEEDTWDSVSPSNNTREEELSKQGRRTAPVEYKQGSWRLLLFAFLILMLKPEGQQHVRAPRKPPHFFMEYLVCVRCPLRRPTFP
jgi:hypothetical protein